MPTKPHYEHLKPTQWRKAHYLWWTFFLVNMAFVWITPLDVLDRYPQLVAFTDFMASWNTQIRHLGEYSGAASQANRFCASVIWCVMPLVMMRIFGADFGIAKTRVQITITFSSLISMIALLLMLLMLLIVPYRSVEASRLGSFLFLCTAGRSVFLPGSVYLSGVLIFALNLCLVSAFRRTLVVTLTKKMTEEKRSRFHETTFDKN